MKEPSDLRFAFDETSTGRKIRQRKRPTQDRAKVTVDAVLEATIQVLITDGYTRLTTTRVAERAGVSVGTLYQYFPEKRSLVIALKDVYLRRLTSAVTAAARESQGKRLDVRMRAIIAAVIQVKQKNLELSLALREPLAELGGSVVLRRAMGDIVAVVRQVIIDAGLDLPAEAPVILAAALEGVLAMVINDAPKLLSSDVLADELFALTKGYLRRR